MTTSSHVLSQNKPYFFQDEPGSQRARGMEAISS
jgi:hypothetical protein